MFKGIGFVYALIYKCPPKRVLKVEIVENMLSAFD